jgi:hypothetical protein
MSLERSELRVAGWEVGQPLALEDALGVVVPEQALSVKETRRVSATTDARMLLGI